MTKRTYSNDQITVNWDSTKCHHCRACAIGLPEVFNPYWLE